jgi:uncharacterized protein (TIGR02466 family)
MKAELHFSTPIYSSFNDRFVKSLNKISDNLILKAKKENTKLLKDRDKNLGNKIGDHGLSYHSKSLIDDKSFENFRSYIGELSVAILDSQGYDLKNHLLFFKELWVQQFADKGGGHHNTHVHFDSHLSGFYFLKASDKTPFPIFHDPRTRKDMIQLPRKNINELDVSIDMINFKVKPGSLIIFPSYLPHEFDIDHGIETFRFIHFNLQAISKDILK